MGVSRTVEKEWEEEYAVHQVRFVPQRGVFSKPDRLVVIVQQEEQDNSRIIELPFEKAVIVYEDGASPALTLHKQLVDQYVSSHSYRGGGKLEELVKAEFKLPIGYSIL